MNGRRLTIALSILVLALILLHDAVLGLLTAGLFREKYNQDAFGYARMSARPVAEAYERYYRSGYYKFRELVGDVMAMNPDLDRLALIDVTGAVLFDSREFTDGPAPAPAPPLPPQLLAAVKDLSPTCRIAEGPDGRSVLDIIVPYVEEWGRHRYSVRYQIRYRSWGDVRAEFWTRLAAAGLISFLLGAVLAALLVRRLWRGRPEPAAEGDAQP